MIFFIWAIFLMIIYFWVLGYYYIKFVSDISAKEHKASMTQSKLKDQIEGLEKENKRLEESISKLTKEIEMHREKRDQLSQNNSS